MIDFFSVSLDRAFLMSDKRKKGERGEHHLHEFGSEAESPEFRSDGQGGDVAVPLLTSHRSLRLPHDCKRTDEAAERDETSNPERADELTVAHQFTTRSLGHDEVLGPVSQVLQVKWDPILRVKGQRNNNRTVSHDV
ncbi:hypothetical protein INR49_018009 [Caranx melampygus]|nr:hypothetical protein INR49_018009 [Caranx melampygus]